MTVIKITNFGGEMPSVSPRALPDNAAQVNANLFLATPEFRPLLEDTSVASIASGAQTLYRLDRKADGSFNTNPATGWITSAQERSYVKGQIDDELTERTYVTFDDGSAKPRAIDVTGSDRVLGVPRPVKLVPVQTVTDEFTSDEAGNFVYEDMADQIKFAISTSLTSDAVLARRNGSNIYAGPTNLHGAVFSDNATVISAGLGDRIADVWFTVPAARAAQIKLANFAVFDVLPNGDYLMAFTCVPWTPVLDESMLTAALLAITYPAAAMGSAGLPVLSVDSTAAIIAAVKRKLDVGLLVGSEKEQLQLHITAFYNALFSAPVVDDGNDDEIWEIQREFVNRTQVGFNLVVSIERIMRNAFDGVINGATISEVLAALGGTAALGVESTDRIMDSRFYLATFVTDWGEESEPSEPSDLLEVDQNDTIVITRPNLTTAESHAARNITKWRLYRANAGNTSAAFQFVEELPVATTAFTDIKKSSELGEVCPTITWQQPPYRMDAQSDTYPFPVSGSNPYLRGLVGMPNGIMAGFFDNTVAFCEPYVPYAWPVEYQMSTEFPIVGLGVFGQTLFVGTTGNPYFINGADSASMSAQKVDSNQACVSKKAIVSVQGGVLFVSPDGLCAADANGITVVSAGIYTREDWQKLNPPRMFAAEHESIYYLFYDNGAKGCLTFDLASKKLGRIDLQADAVFVERVSDTLYLALGTSINAVFGAATRRTGRWKSKLITLPVHAPFAWLQVFGDQSVGVPVTVRWYAEGVLRYTSPPVTGVAPIRLPAGRWNEHEIEIETKARVTSLILAGSTQELQTA